MEQLCGRSDRDPPAESGSDVRFAVSFVNLTPAQPVCSRCGLTHAETVALARARADEKAGKRTTMPAGHFNQPEIMDPHALPHDPRLSTRVGHTHYAPQPPMDSSPHMSQYEAASPRLQHGGFGAAQPQAAYPPERY